MITHDEVALPRLDELRHVARTGLVGASAVVAGEGVPGCDARGQLIRPLLALAGTQSAATAADGFWDGVLAVQLAHEASLLHDDVIDSASTRRGEPTLAAAAGVARALLRGDHLLTAAYRAAARTGSISFAQLFSRAVERTVAGEGAQGALAGQMLDLARAEAISLSKSGELMGCSLAAGAVLDGGGNALEVFELGRRVGLFYQMLDDLLDYCPAADTGKPALGDYASRRWTWVLSECPSLGFGLAPAEAAAMLHKPDAAGSPMLRALAKLGGNSRELQAEAEALIPHPEILGAMLADWLAVAEAAVAAETGVHVAASADRGGGADLFPQFSPLLPASGTVGADIFEGELAIATPGFRKIGAERAETIAAASTPRPDRSGLCPVVAADIAASPGSESLEEWVREELRRRIPGPDSVRQYLARNSRSFRFASRFFIAADAERVARVYAYCRITDDLVDTPCAQRSREALLDGWIGLSREAYEGGESGLPLLQQVMREMKGARVPFDYAAELAEGMRMDLRGERYSSRAELRRYTYRVASVVGLWLTRLWGMHEPRLLDGAERLGHAMQLTNILRDVGEDLRAGRLYLPADLLAAHGVEELDLHSMQESGQIAPAYRQLIEELMEAAERDYDAALGVLGGVPVQFARAIAASAHIYRGIHAEIRRNGYDNLSRRAYTSQLTKARLAFSGLWELKRASAGVRVPGVAAVFTHGGSR